MALGLALAMFLPAVVRAQSCHMPDLHVDDGRPFRISARSTFASYRTAIYAGEYQGYAASASYSQRWLFVEGSLAGYRIVRNGLTDRGLGDLAVDVRGTIVRNQELAAGVELAATFPTGDAGRGLGMGHTMLMPGVWASFQRDSLSIVAQVAYGRAITAGGSHAHHGSSGALVNPMNRSELEHALTVSYGFAEHLFAGGRLLGALPVVAVGGAAREVAAFGFGALFAPLQLDLELQMPLVGTPFETRTLLTIAVLF